MGPEGELRVDVRLRGGRVSDVDIVSTRPDVAAAMLRGRSRQAVGAALPLLFSVCGRSQAVAGELAWAVAVGETIGREALDRSVAAVSTEVVREAAWRVILDWPRWLNERPDDDAVAAARSAGAIGSGTDPGTGSAAIARTVFGCPAAEWLGRDTLTEFDRWLDAGGTAAARLLRADRDADAATIGRRVPDGPLIDGDAIAAGTASGAEHTAIGVIPAGPPTWRGAPAETGALARLRARPLIEAIDGRSNSRLPARFAARLLELALLIDGRHRARVGTGRLGPDTAMGWVENARGLLIHTVRVDGGVATGYRIVAPTDWNFHPRGALFAGMVDAPGDDAAAVEQLARRTVRSLDPCVDCSIEVHHA